MNNFRKYIFYALLPLCGSACLLSSCSEAWMDENAPRGVISDADAYKEPDKLCNAAYAYMGDDWFEYPFDLWPYGDLAADDCLKGGSGITDTSYHPNEMWNSFTSSSGHIDPLWYRLYCGMSRCNRAIIALNSNGVSALGKDTAPVRMGEMKFLRAFFYYKLVKLFNKVPRIDEVVEENVTHESTRNDVLSHDQQMQLVVNDLTDAYNSLPEEQSEGGRANKYAAASALAKVYLDWAYGDGYEANTGYDHVNSAYIDQVLKYTEEVKSCGKYDYLKDFGDVFMTDNKNSKESIFSIQHSLKTSDGTDRGRANWSTMLNGAWGMWSCGWDFHKPTQNLVNAFKTENGLPMFDDYDKDHNVYPIKGKTMAQKYDPRLFHTVGMPSWPYKYESEYTMTTDNARTPGTYGYYCSLKEVPQRSKGDYYYDTWQTFDQNEYVFRFADVMLMRAEALIEKGKLGDALTIINEIRRRAADSVSKHISYASDFCEIKEYPANYFTDKEVARKCLRWERRLEMAMESSRFFDLRRWGMASETINNFYKSECKSEYEGGQYAQYLEGAYFTKGKNEYWPVPYQQMKYVPGLYTQNPGYDN